ncbi:MAG: hypothetical protein ACKOUT_07955 [Novosphingobium sp.]
MTAIRRAALAGALALLCAPLAGAAAQSVGDFRLQPKETPTTQAQGPVDRDAPVVRPATPVPVPTQASPPVAAPSPAATATTAPAASAPSPSSAARPSTAAQPRSKASAASTTASPTALPTDAPASTDASPVTASAEAQVPVAVETFEPSPSAGKVLPFDLWWLAIPAALFVLAGLWLMLRRKRGETDDYEDYAEAPAAEPPVLAETPPIAARAPAPNPAVPAAAPVPEPALAQWSGDTLAISLDVGRMSATLVNTALSWRLIVENRSDKPLGPVVVAGDMIAAHASLSVEQQLATDGQPLELIDDIGVIAPGGQAELRGEFRVPLSSINPIQAGSALLYIPLARFRVEAEGATTLATFAIGETPPVAKAALLPFRLDLGPRVWARISQRQVDRQPIAA